MTIQTLQIAPIRLSSAVFCESAKMLAQSIYTNISINVHLNREWRKTAIKPIVLAELISVIVSGVPTAATMPATSTQQNPMRYYSRKPYIKEIER